MSEGQSSATADEKLRSLTTKPFEDADAEAGPSAVKRAALTALAAAVAGGLAGAAQELLSRRAEDGDGSEPDDHDDRDEAGAHDEDEAQDEAEAEPEDEREEQPEPQAAAEEHDEDEEPEEQPGPDEEEPQAAEREEPSEDDDRSRDGAAPGKAGELVRNARSQLEELIGAEPETVSAMRRGKDGWEVTFEVVEIRRVPESTDVLASYVVTLDDDGKLLDFDRRRRYRRAQVDEG